ncbi:MAG: PAS domain S-box protein, partial [Chloroflexi bacterium]|nr:PAS domain S-box protein [Chloroflexota bacterium]
MKTDQAHFESLIRNAADMIIALDAQGLIRYASPSVERVLGYKPRGAIGKSFFAWIHPDDLPAAQEAFASRRAKPGVAPAPLQVRGRCKDGSWRVIEALGTNLLDDPAVGALILNARDVTRRVEGEKRLSIQHAVTLALSEADTLAEAMPKILQAVCEGLDWKRGECWSAHWSVDKATMRLQCIESCQIAQGESPQFETITSEIKFEPGEGLPGRVFASGKPEWTPDIAKDGFARVAQALKAGYRAAFAFPVKVGSETLGVKTFLDGKIRPPDAGQLQIMESIGHQIGQFVERKRAEQGLKESEERYRDLVENTRDLICTHDLEGRFLSVNRAVAEGIGYSPEELTGKNLQEFLAPDVRAEFDAYLAEIRESGISSGVIKIQTKNGEERLWEYRNTLRVEGVAAPIVRGFAHDVTERVRASQALKKSEERFRSLVEHSSDEISIVDAEASLLYESPSANPLLGYKPGEFLGQSLFSLIHPDDQERVQNKLAQMIASPATQPRDEFRLKHRNGSWLWVEAVGTNLLADPAVRGVVINYHDITERKRAEEAIWREKIFSDSLINSLPGVFYLLNDQGYFLRWNENFEKASGYTAEEFSKLRALDLFGGADKEWIRQRIEKVFTDGEADAEALLIPKSGSGVPYYFTGRRIEVDGAPCLIGMGVDVTERKQAEEARRESEERYRLLFENSLDAILLTMPDGAILAANPAACAMFGLTEAEICAHGRAGLVDITDPQLPLLLAERERTGKAQGELRMLRKGSTPFPTEISSAMYQDAQGNVQTTIVIRDITERKRAEESLRQSEERFSSAFNSSPAGIAITVEDGRILDVNPTLLQSLGYERDEVVGKHPHDINLWGSPAEREKINAALERDGRVSNLEIQVHAKSGALRDMLLSSEPVTLGSEACLLTIFHDVTDVRRAEQEARLLQTIALGVSGVKGLDETIQNILQLVCESTGWTMGEAWIPSTDGTRLERHPAWFSREPGLEEFREASAEFTFEPGGGLPGRAWQSHRAVWVEDVTQDPNFPRAELARQAGLKTGMGVPVLGTEEARQAGLRAGVSIPVIANGQVTLVLDFFLREARLQDPRLIELISAVAAELGIVIERKRAQEEMRKAEEKYRALVEESPNVLYLDKADEDSACVYISPQVETLLGYSPADFENEPLLWHKVVDPRDYEIAARSIRTTLERGKADSENRMLARDGRAKWVHDMSVLVKDAGGNPQFLQGFLEDITARKEAEEALRKSEKRYRHLFETNLAGVYRSHMDGRLLTCNDAFARIYGYESSAEMMLHSTRELYRTADDHENFFALLRERTSLIGYESEGRRRDGTSIWLLENTALVPDEAGEMKEIEGTLVDITARKEAEEALREAERFARSTLDALTSNISVLDESGTIIAVNRAWREFAEANGGDSQSTGVGVNYLEVCDSAGGKDSLFGADMAACIRSVLRGEQDTYEIEYPCHSPDEQRWFVARISRFEADGPMRVVVSHGDITKRKLAETSLRSRVIELEAISKIAAALRAAQTLEEILPLLLGETLAALDSEAGSISLYRAESGELYKAAAQGWLSNLPYMLIKPGAGIMGTVFSSGKLHVSREFVSDPLLLPSSAASIPPGWGGVCIPLRAANEVVGVIFVSAPLPREFSPEEIKLLVSISEIAGTAIHRLR